jgi:hypothetical protein
VTDDRTYADASSERDPRQRVRREESARQDPIRNWWNLFRQAQPGGAVRGNGTEPNGQKSWSRAVDRGVKLSYQVIDDQIRQGQRLAEEINGRSYGVQSMNRDFQELAMRSMRYYVDAASLFMDFFSTMPATLGTSAFRPSGEADASTANGEPDGAKQPPAQTEASVPVATRVRSSCPATVTVDVKAAFARRRLSISGLYSTDNGQPPITGVAFETSDNGGPVLTIEVPEAHPAGLYAGVLIDQETGAAGGTVSLRLSS